MKAIQLDFLVLQRQPWQTRKWEFHRARGHLSPWTRKIRILLGWGMTHRWCEDIGNPFLWHRHRWACQARDVRPNKVLHHQWFSPSTAINARWTVACSCRLWMILKTTYCTVFYISTFYIYYTILYYTSPISTAGDPHAARGQMFPIQQCYYSMSCNSSSKDIKVSRWSHFPGQRILQETLKLFVRACRNLQ